MSSTLSRVFWYHPSIMTNKLLLAGVLLVASVLSAEDGDRLLTIDHYVRVKSIVPSIAGQMSQIYVRERAKAATPLRGGNLADRVVLFVHGAGTPAEVAFDVPYKDYSWMAYLARAGFDVFSMDVTFHRNNRRRSSHYFSLLPVRPATRETSQRSHRIGTISMPSWTIFVLCAASIV